jgi:hypothetical protein
MLCGWERRKRKDKPHVELANVERGVDEVSDFLPPFERPTHSIIVTNLQQKLLAGDSRRLPICSSHF